MSIQQRILSILALDKAFAKDKAPRLVWRMVVLLVMAAILLVSKILASFPNFVERTYSEGIDPVITVVLGRITSIVPFSVAEVLLDCILLYLLVSALRAVYFVCRRQRRVRNAFSNAVVRLASIASILVFLFYFNWALNFDRPNLIKRMDWNARAAQKGPNDKDELVRLNDQLVDKVNACYRRLFNTDDIVHVTAPPSSMAAMNDAVENGYKNAAPAMNLPKTFAVTRGPIKPVWASWVMSDLLTLGVYTPWTGEANYNREFTPCGVPQVMAHEKAHQRCVTNEDEANFFGFIACAYSDDPYAQYSGYLFAHRQLLIELLKIDKARGEAILKRRLPGVQKDVNELNEFTKRHLGAVGKASHMINNAYLRANGVAGGVGSYQLSARLLVVFSRANGGTCLIEKK